MLFRHGNCGFLGTFSGYEYHTRPNGFASVGHSIRHVSGTYSPAIIDILAILSAHCLLYAAVEITEQHHELCSLIKKHIYPWRKLTIGVDGRDGAGKSGLARYLAWEFDLPTIEADMLIISDDDPPSYRYADLGRLIESRHNLNRPVIVEGVFLLHTLAKLNVVCDFLVYVENEEQTSSDYLEKRLKQYDNDFDPKGSADYIFAWCIDR